MAADPIHASGSILPACIAYRGASGEEPENTLRAFARALDQGATWLELDVHLVHDRLPTALRTRIYYLGWVRQREEEVGERKMLEALGYVQ